MGWLLRWLIWRLFLKPRGRFIFHYFDGRTLRRIDPIVAYRRWVTHPTYDWTTAPQLIGVAEEAVALDASRDLAAAVRDVFEVPPFERGGLTETECRQLFLRFLDYTADVKKNSRPSPIASPSTDSGSCPGGTDAPDDSITKPVTDCCSTPSGSSCGPPTESHSESAGPCPDPAPPP